MVFVVAGETILEIAKKVQNEERSKAINTGTAKRVLNVCVVCEASYEL